MLYVRYSLKSMGLKVKLPMILEMDNKGTVDLANNWSIGGSIRHVDIRQCFLQELKESKLMEIRCIKGLEKMKMRSPRTWMVLHLRNALEQLWGKMFT